MTVSPRNPVELGPRWSNTSCPAASNVLSCRIMGTSSTPYSSGSRSAAAPGSSTMIMPATPRYTWSAVEPCGWAWYQRVAAGWLTVHSGDQVVARGHQLVRAAVHPRRQPHAVPVQRRLLGQAVGHVDVDRLAGAHPQRGPQVRAVDPERRGGAPLAEVGRSRRDREREPAAVRGGRPVVERRDGQRPAGGQVLDRGGGRVSAPRQPRRREPRQQPADRRTASAVPPRRRRRAGGHRAKGRSPGVARPERRAARDPRRRPGTKLDPRVTTHGVAPRPELTSRASRLFDRCLRSVSELIAATWQPALRQPGALPDGEPGPPPQHCSTSPPATTSDGEADRRRVAWDENGWWRCLAEYRAPDAAMHSSYVSLASVAASASCQSREAPWTPHAATARCHKRPSSRLSAPATRFTYSAWVGSGRSCPPSTSHLSRPSPSLSSTSTSLPNVRRGTWKGHGERRSQPLENPRLQSSVLPLEPQDRVVLLVELCHG